MTAPAQRPAPEVEEPPSTGRRGWLVLGLVLAAGATAAVFFTENPLYLRIALLAVCWAFVVAAFLAGSRRADQAVAAGREAELRHAYDLELEREVAARHEYEVGLESRLRREAEDAMRAELAQLRGELAGLTAMREDLAAVTQLRADLGGLGQLRAELAALTEFRGELAGLGELRASLADLGELRTDLGRMRSELTEQLSGELLIERMVMRAQSVRGPAQPAPQETRTLEGTTSWDVDRWQETRVVPAEQAEPAPQPIAGPPPVPAPATPASARVDEETAAYPPSPREWLGDRSLLDEHGRPTGEIPIAHSPEPAPRRHRRAAEPDDDELVPSATWSPSSPAYQPPSPSYEPPADRGGAAYDGSVYDEILFGAVPPTPSYEVPSYTPSYEVPSYEAPSYTPSYEVPSYEAPSYDSSGYVAPVEEPVRPVVRESSGHARLEQILAESGVEAPSGGRSRRRRYRDEDGGTAGDDVLARVLGRN